MGNSGLGVVEAGDSLLVAIGGVVKEIGWESVSMVCVMDLKSLTDVVERVEA